MKRKFLALSMVTVLGAILVGCGEKETGSPTPAPSDDETFVVGMEANYPPYNWSQLNDKNGAVKINDSMEYAGGYDVEIAKRVAEGLGKELVIVKSDWDGLIPSVQLGKIDAIIAGMSPTAKRLESIDFSDTYYESQLVMVVNSEGPYANATSLADFNGARVTAQLGTFHYDMIDQIPGVDGQAAMADFATMRISLLSGKIDAYVSERPEGISAELADSKYKMIELTDGFKTSPEETQTSVGVAKGSELTEQINRILAEISAQERMDLMDDAIENQPLAQ